MASTPVSWSRTTAPYSSPRSRGSCACRPVMRGSSSPPFSSRRFSPAATSRATSPSTPTSSKLLSSSLPWRQQEIKLNALFPQRTDLIVAVIDATTPEAADEAADALAKALAPQTNVFRTVTRPDGGEFFARNGILFLSVDDLRTQYGRTDQSGAFPRHARPRSDFARDPRRHLAIARRRSAQKNDARRHRAGGLRRSLTHWKRSSRASIRPSPGAG